MPQMQNMTGRHSRHMESKPESFQRGVSTMQIGCSAETRYSIWRKATSVTLIMLTFVGCARGPSIGQVRGKVTLEGKPVDHATVTFQPTSGLTSYGVTDRDGSYELRFSRDRPGAIVGMHEVSIGTYRVSTGADGNPAEFPETIPEVYNARTELRREVKPGQQTIDFHLENGKSG